MSNAKQFGLARWLRALAGAAALIVAGAAGARIEGATGPTFSLVAKSGYISTADGGSIYNWGYAIDVGGASQMFHPGPTLIVNQGQTVSITLRNELPTNVSIIFPGQSDVATTGGVAGKVAREAAPNGAVTYSFVAAQAGTYIYHSGTQMSVQLEMGLFGALIVRPPTLGQAYEHAGTRFDREHLFVLSEIDPVWHEIVRAETERQIAAPVPNWAINPLLLPAHNPLYWFINGRNAPDTLGENYAPNLPAQPYNALARMHPGERTLMRMINAGRDLHPFHHHGNNTWTLAVDGRVLSSAPGAGPDLARSDNTLRMIPGQTVDAIYEWTGKGLGWDVYGKQCNPALPASNPASCAAVYAADPLTADPRALHQDPADRGKPAPTVIPSALELTFGDMYSGSPYLGAKGDVPVGAGRLGSGGAYFHMWHSHNEREIINNGIFPGGMMTMVVIEPWTVTID